MHVPPLRERREDIPLLVAYLVEKKGATLGKRVDRIPRRTMELLTAYDWPGNVRELENVIERALILSRGPALVVDSAVVAVAGDRGGTTPIGRRASAEGTTPTTLATAGATTSSAPARPAAGASRAPGPRPSGWASTRARSTSG